MCRKITVNVENSLVVREVSHKFHCYVATIGWFTRKAKAWIQNPIKASANRSEMEIIASSSRQK